MRLSTIGLASLVVTASASASGEVVRLEIRDQTTWAGGQKFGAGSYEAVSGTVWYEIDPNSLEARDITDIRLAPRNARGMVEYHGPFLILRPSVQSAAPAATIFEVEEYEV